MKRNMVLIVMLVLVFGSFTAVWAAKPIKVGAPLSLTGPYAGDGLGYLRGIEMAVDELNQQGGLLGKSLEIVKFDTQDFSPERVMQAADQLVRKERVAAIHAGWAGWGQDVRAYGKYDVPTFVWDASINAVAVYRENPERYFNWFMLNATEKGAGLATTTFLEAIDYSYPNKKIALITTDDSWGLEIGKGIKEGAEKRDWKIALSEVVPYGTREWGPILTKIRAIQPAFIHLEIVSSPDLITFFRQFLKDPTPSIVSFGYGGTLPDFLPNLGQEANGLIMESIMIPEPAPTPESAAWVERFRQRYEAEPAAGSFAVYTGVMIWAEAVRQVGKIDDYKAINKYLDEHKFKTLEGRYVWFDDDHKIPNTVWPVNWIQIQNGKMVTLFLTGDTLDELRPYMDFKFQTPPWIK